MLISTYFINDFILKDNLVINSPYTSPVLLIHSITLINIMYKPVSLILSVTMFKTVGLSLSLLAFVLLCQHQNVAVGFITKRNLL